MIEPNDNNFEEIDKPTLWIKMYWLKDDPSDFFIEYSKNLTLSHIIQAKHELLCESLLRSEIGERD